MKAKIVEMAHAARELKPILINKLNSLKIVATTPDSTGLDLDNIACLRRPTPDFMITHF